MFRQLLKNRHHRGGLDRLWDAPMRRGGRRSIGVDVSRDT